MSLPNSADLFSRRVALAVCGLVAVLFGVYALNAGQDANWDLQNYHWYNPYAFLTDRLAQDIAPAHTPTFYNPTLDIPLYLAAEHLSGRTLAFVLGVLQGLNFTLTYLIALRLFAQAPVIQRRISALGLALVGVLGGGNFGLVGTTFYDNIVSLFVLGAVLTVVSAARPTGLRLFIAGTLVGMGAGLKLPTVVFAVGLCAACFVIGAHLFERFRNSFVFGVGVLAGFAIFAAHWTFYLWTTYDNPVFPYFNHVFQSDMGLSANYRDMRFIPATVLEAIFFPLVMAFSPAQTGEIVFRDWRIAAAFVALITLPLAALAQRRFQREQHFVDMQAATYVIAACVTSYVVWLGIFGIYRYLVPLEMLAPLIIAIAISLWPGPTRLKTNVTIAVMALLMVTTKPGTWGRVPFGDKFVSATAPSIAAPETALVLMLGNRPTAWVIPFFPPQVSFVRIQGYIVHPDDGATGLNRAIRSRIEGHTGALYTLIVRDDRLFAHDMLSRYRLTYDETSCRPVEGNLAPQIELCNVMRVAEQ
jgi:hypothetical protein